MTTTSERNGVQESGPVDVEHLGLTGGMLNLVFHDLTDGPTAAPFCSTLRSAAEMLQWLRSVGLAARTRIYFDDNHRSLYDLALVGLDLSGFHDIVAAVPVTSIDNPGHGTFSDITAARRQGVRVVAHGYSHVRLASYSPGGELLPTSLGGPYADRDPSDSRPLTENEVLFQLVECLEHPDLFDPGELVLPYGCFNPTTLALNDRLGLYQVLSTSDPAIDYGQLLRPRLLVTGTDTPTAITRKLREVLA